MDIDFDYFLLIAEENNISRAAKRAFISQQSMSKYLKQLEDKIGVPLFTRKPAFRLTPAGEIVLQHARQIKAISLNMNQELDELNEKNYGLIRFGTSFGRALQLIPMVFPSFHKRYPNVHLDVKFGMTGALAESAFNGNLDIFIGISMPDNPSLTRLHLADEKIYLAISDELLLRYFPQSYPECKLQFSHGVHLKDFSHVPFTRNPEVSTMNRIVNNYCEKEQLNFTYIATVNSNGLQLALASKGCAACLFPQFLTPLGNMMNQAGGSLEHINLYPVTDLGYQNEISLFYGKHKHLPQYMKHFISLVQKAFYEYPPKSFLGVGEDRGQTP